MWDAAHREVILSYGHDAILLVTRQRVLEQIGTPVSFVTTATEFRAAVRNAEPTLIVLCQSLSAEECACAAFFIKEHSPATKVLAMYIADGHCRLLPQDHEEFFSPDGPAALVKTVKRILRGRPPEPAGDHSFSGLSVRCRT